MDGEVATGTSDRDDLLLAILFFGFGVSELAYENLLGIEGETPPVPLSTPFPTKATNNN